MGQASELEYDIGKEGKVLSLALRDQETRIKEKDTSLDSNHK